jgi:hypothetical protein
MPSWPGAIASSAPAASGPNTCVPLIIVKFRIVAEVRSSSPTSRG